MKFTYHYKNNIRVGKLDTAHGIIDTPVFMPVGTIGSVKGISWEEIKEINGQIILGNTYHLYLRPGVDFFKKHSGLHKFINWQGPILTDSGGFQVFSLGYRFKQDSQKGDLKEQNFNSLVKIEEDGVKFKSYLDGSLHKFTPKSVIDAQIAFGSDIMMVLDVCTEFPSDYKRAKETMELTHKWARESVEYFRACQRRGVGKSQNLFGIVQGSTYQDLREESAKYISSLDFDGIAIGGVSVGEGKENMKKVLDWVLPHLPENKPRYLMGVGEPDDLILATQAGVDMFDCVLPTRLGRHGTVWVKKEDLEYTKIDLRRNPFREDFGVIEQDCQCFSCRNHYSRSYLGHLLREKELLGLRLASIHNLHIIENLMQKIRENGVKVH